MRNSDHGKDVGRSVAQSLRPPSRAWSESAIKTYSASSPPTARAPTRAGVISGRLPRSARTTTSAALTQTSAAISTGPHQRSGTRNKMSQSSRVAGQSSSTLSQA